MKVGIITFHFVNNFGGALQAYALQKTVADSFASQCELIDYRNWFIVLTDTIRLFPVTADWKEFISGWKTFPKRLARVKRFGRFLKEMCVLSDRCHLSRMHGKQDWQKYDKYICGSDQIWNPFITMGVSKKYFLGFADKPKNKERKAAYAPSFGMDQIEQIPWFYRNRMRKYLNGIGFLSVREEAGRKIIKELTGRDAVRLIDPVFLLEKREWERLAGRRRKEKPYILLYMMQKDKTVYHYAKRVKEEKALRLVEISRYGYQPDFVDETLVDVGPREFLRLFREAEYICTNSYHGLVYSIIFEKEFCLVPCRHFQSRIIGLLELLHIKGADVKENLTVSYDREYVRKAIEKERKKAMNYLEVLVGGEKDHEGI